MRLSLDFYEEMRSNLRISDIVRKKVNLTKKGREYSGLCPFHGEKTPSFTVNDAKRFYHCFGCGAHGDVIKFVSETYGISYKDAAIRLANENNIELPKFSKIDEEKQEETDRIYEILNMANSFFRKNLNNSVIDYLEMRGLSQATIERFSIGYAPGNKLLEKFMEQNSVPADFLLKTGLCGKDEKGQIYSIFNKRIMFPIKNIYNKIVGFGGRSVGNAMPKYINSPETIIFKKSEIMYGEDIATSQSYKDNYSIIVEGYMDVIALHQAGFKQAVASLGTSVTEKHLKKLWRSADEIIACLDGDQAGIRASNRLIEMSLPKISSEKIISFTKLPENVDPDDLIKDHGSKNFQRILDQRISLSEIIWQNEFGDGNFATAESKATLEKKLANYAKLVTDRQLQNNFQRYFKDMVWQQIVRRNNNTKPTNIVSANKSLPLSIKKYSEIEYLEKAICSFLLKYPDLIVDYSEKIQLKDENLCNFKNFLEKIALDNESINLELITEKVKNTGFNYVFDLLSNFNSLSLDYNFPNDKNINNAQILEWLCKKHYLLILKNEYVTISRKNTYEVEQVKVKSYLKEIQEITQDLQDLSEKFLVDN